jgi:GNAT superfamily N-acetyltransferase
LLHFKKHCELAAGQQVRFDAEIGDQMTIKTLGEVFPESAITTYLHYFKSIRDVTAIEQPSFITKDENSLNRIRNILLCLKDYSLSNLIELMKANELVVYEIDDIPVSVLHYKEENFNTCEIITLATADDSRGKGCGTALLNKFFGFAASQFNSIILKVKENNLTAVRLYEKTGFQKVENKTEQWWYVVPKP